MTSNTTPVHPGRVLYEQAMQPLGVSRNTLARDIDVPVGRISDIVSGKRGITPDTALRRSKYFGTDAELWMRLQSDYDLHVARHTIWPEVAPRVRAFEPVNQPATPVEIVPPDPMPAEIPHRDLSAPKLNMVVETEAGPATLANEVEPGPEQDYVPWKLEISEVEEESLDISELDAPVYSVDPGK